MEKSVFTPEYEILLKQLRSARKAAGVTQVEMAERLALTQSLVSKIERGDRRLDVIELRRFCKAIGMTLTEFVSQLERKLGKR